MSTAGISPFYVTCWQGYTNSNSKVGSRESLRKYLSSIRATGVTWWIEIDLERELSAFARSLACSAGPVHPVVPSVGSLRSSRQDLSRMPKIVEIVKFKPKLRQILVSDFVVAWACIHFNRTVKG